MPFVCNPTVPCTLPTVAHSTMCGDGVTIDHGTSCAPMSAMGYEASDATALVCTMGMLAPAMPFVCNPTVPCTLPTVLNSVVCVAMVRPLSPALTGSTPILARSHAMQAS